MNPRLPGRPYHDLRIGISIETGDVAGDRAAQQFDVLRQISDMTPQALRRPLAERRAIETNGAALGAPYAHQRPRQ